MSEENEMDYARIGALLAPFGIEPTEAQLAQIQAYIRLLLHWNLSLNLTSVRDPEGIVQRHFGESMFLTKVLPVENCRLADIGSGAGFPGMAIKLICPTIRLTLIESNQKRRAFLAEVVRGLNFEGVEIVAKRFEDLRTQGWSLDVLTARAIGEIPKVLKWAKNSVASAGHIALWLGGQDAIKVSRTAGWDWGQPIQIPESQQRFILIGAPSEGKPERSSA